MTAEELQAVVDQLRALKDSPDITEMQGNRPRYLKQAEGSAGTMGGIKGNNLGANIGRAAYGISGAIKNYQADKLSAPITSGKESLYGNLIRNFENRSRILGAKPEELLDPNNPIVGPG